MIKPLFACLLALGALCSPHAGAAVPASWKATGLSINADGMTLARVLREFGKAYGVKLDVQVPASHRLAGRLQADGGAAFLDRLAASHHFTWFVYNGTLYVVPLDDTRSVRIEVGEDAVQDARAALQGLGLYDARFGWGELPDEGVVLISGPREYVRLAGEILLPGGKKKAPAQERQMMLFRLKYASATDRVITLRGNRETLPGLKTILSNLLNPASAQRLTGPAPASSPSFEMASRKRSRTGPLGPGQTRELGFAAGAEALRAALPLPSIGGALANDADDGSEAAEDGGVAGTDGRRRDQRAAQREERPRIEADPALNAILIYDDVARRESYQRLIDDLDVEPAQVEIEALIVDIDRTRLADMGVEWSLAIGNTSLTVNGGAGDSAGIALPLPGSTLLIRNAARFYARLKALEGTGEARVLAKPTVLTLENVAAVMDLSQTAYIPLVGERVSDLADITAGTMLRVVPRILREGGRGGKDGKDREPRVRLDIDIEDGGLSEVGGKTNANRATITTQAMIELQQTLMIGGYHSEQTMREQHKVPLLGDLAGIGGLFRNESSTRRDRERLFLITPRLVQGGTAAPRRSSASRAAMLMVDTPSLQVAPEAAKAPKP